ncbi:MAG: hypothetical protein QW734_03780 [Candidatus Bathyarchaeia archaeon]
MEVKLPEIRTVTYSGLVNVDPNITTTLFEKTLGITEKFFPISLEITAEAGITITLLRTIKGAEQDLVTFLSQFSPIDFNIPDINITTKKQNNKDIIEIPNLAAKGFPEVDFGQKIILRATHSLPTTKTVGYKLKGVLVIYR